MHAAFLDKNTSTCWMVVLVLLDLNVESGDYLGTADTNE